MLLSSGHETCASAGQTEPRSKRQKQAPRNISKRRGDKRKREICFALSFFPSVHHSRYTLLLLCAAREAWGAIRGVHCRGCRLISRVLRVLRAQRTAFPVPRGRGIRCGVRHETIGPRVGVRGRSLSSWMQGGLWILLFWWHCRRRWQLRPDREGLHCNRGRRRDHGHSQGSHNDSQLGMVQTRFL